MKPDVDRRWTPSPDAGLGGDRLDHLGGGKTSRWIRRRTLHGQDQLWVTPLDCVGLPAGAAPGSGCPASPRRCNRKAYGGCVHPNGSMMNRSPNCEVREKCPEWELENHRRIAAVEEPPWTVPLPLLLLSDTAQSRGLRSRTPRLSATMDICQPPLGGGPATETKACERSAALMSARSSRSMSLRQVSGDQNPIA